MINIDERLNEIIIKYNLDRHYPQYRKMLMARKVLKRYVDDLVESKKITLFICDSETLVRMISRLANEDECISFLNIQEKELKKLENVEWENYDKIVMLSFYNVEYIFRWFRTHNIAYEWIYDVFETEGIYFEREFYKFCKESYNQWFDNFFPGKAAYYKDAVQMELYFQQQKVEKSVNDKVKLIALEKCFFISLYFRNFLKVKEYSEMLIDITQDDIWSKVQNEIYELLSFIKDKLGTKREGIILYWLDALEYGTEADMEYFKEVISKAVSFENAFTSTPFTNATLKAMLLGKTMVDDQTFEVKRIQDKDSEIITFLKSKGYKIKLISGYLNELESEHCIDTFMDMLTPVSMKLFAMLEDMLNEDDKTIYILHSLSETHHPYFGTDMADELMTDRDSGIWKAKRFASGRKELDEQLRFYDSFINDDITKIYMSDHGQAEFRTRYHIHFNVVHKNMRPRVVQAMFSILDFGKVMRQIIENGEIDESDFAREYVEIQDVDWYNKQRIQSIFKNKENIPTHMFGYKGIVDKNYIYIHFNVGKEWLQKRDEIQFEPISGYVGGDVCDEKLLPYYRSIVGEYPKELLNNEKFRYSRYIHMLYKRYASKCEEKVKLFCKMLENYPDASVGIRNGGIHAERFYTVLPKEYKAKIWGFVDECDSCKCSYFGLPVIDKYAINSSDMKAIVLCSFNERNELIEEATSYKKEIDVLDMYGYLECNGIKCNNWFYLDTNMTDEDYDVGFDFL